MEKQHGSIVVTESGAVVLLTNLYVTGELNGQIQQWDEGVILENGLEGTTAIKIRIPVKHGIRVVASSADVVSLLEKAGFDLRTKAERPSASLTLEERLEKLERENQALRAKAAK